MHVPVPRLGLALALVLLMTLGLGAAGWSAVAGDPAQRFLAAVDALERGQYTRFLRLKAGLEGYTLYPYLAYRDLWARVHTADGGEIRRFLAEHAGSLYAPRVRAAYLDLAGRRGDWDEVRAMYAGDRSAKLRCFWLNARLKHEGVSPLLLDQIVEVWRVGHSQPEACDPLFAELYDSPRLRPALLWERISLAVQNGNAGLARYLAQRLDPAGQEHLTLWLALRRQPARYLRDDRLAEDTALNRTIVSDGLVRWARSDPKSARAAWLTLRDRYGFNDAERGEIEGRIALEAAFDDLPEALDWLMGLPPAAETEGVRAYRTKLALEAGDWPRLLDALEAMPEAVRGENQWRYWRARALEQTGAPASQWRYELAFLAVKRDYFGFLAADRLGQRYLFNNEPLPVDPGTVNALAEDRPSLGRALEFFRIGMLDEARQEWNWGLSGLDAGSDRTLLKAAAELAHRSGWHDRAIITVAQAGHFNDLDLRFPLEHRPLVEREAQRQGIDPAWVFGVMRQESAFIPDVRSSAGALGLMQLLPGTARSVARSERLARPTNRDLYDPALNIRLGAAYLKRLLERFDGNLVLASAAYNAGSGRVRDWRPPAGESMPADEWIATIPFRETRKYVARVLEYTVVYDRALNGDATGLAVRMPPIDGPA